MLREEGGSSLDSAVYSVLPDWQEQVYSWKQLVRHSSSADSAKADANSGLG